MAAEDDDDDDAVPLQHKRPFGSSLRRKQVVFVPASSAESAATHEVPVRPSSAVADLYLDIVLPKESRSQTPSAPPAQRLCEICQLPLDGEQLVQEQEVAATGSSKRHEASIAHQICLKHSHPPSAIDRSRLGLAVLQSQGWDPDSRTGLGATQQGILYPIKAKPKDDTLGIGVQVPKDLQARVKHKAKKLDAKGARKMALEDKKRRERLQQQFYGSGDLEKYLGTR